MAKKTKDIDLTKNPCLDSILHAYFTPKKDTKIFKKVQRIVSKDGEVTYEGLTKAGYKAMEKLHNLLIALDKITNETINADDIIDELYEISATDI